MAHTRAWDETIPLDASQAPLLAQDIRDLKLDIRERMNEILDSVSNWSGVGVLMANEPNINPGLQNNTTYTMDLSLARSWNFQVSGGVLLNFSNVPPLGRTTVHLYLYKNAGATIGWPGAVTWPASIPPVLPDNTLNLIRFTTLDGGAHWVGESAVNLG